MRAVRVELGDRSYNVTIGSGLLPHLGKYLSAITRHPQCAMVVDESVRDTHAALARQSLQEAGFAVCEVPFLASESNKNLHTAEGICRTLLAHDIARNTPLIALGGGITGDTAGFASAVYQRGTPFVQVPTTLLSMVDSSVGGKVAVNLDGSKNMVGAFHQPRQVIVDVDTLSTLDAREMSCGLAECIKHGIIGDADLFHWTREHLDALLGGDTEKLQELIARNVGFKAGVVQRDETEQGERALLNLGHTFGHAIEGTGGAGTYKHGEAIAIGAVAATRFAVEAGMCEASVLGEVESAFASARLPTRLSLDTPVETLLAEMHKDKKNKRQKLALILPKRIGECVMVRDVREDRVRQAWNYVRQG